MVTILREVTDWGEHKIPNHTYFVDKKLDKCVGYIKEGTDQKIMFSKPLRFARARRKFVEEGTIDD